MKDHEPLDVLITVGMPVYNGARFLPDAIGSLLRQTEPRFELVISDDASSDESAVICEAFAKRDPRVRLVRQKSNLGMINNFNRVLHLARGRYFCWASQDDAWHPDYLRLLLRAMERNPRVALAVCRHEYLYSDGSRVVSRELDERAGSFKLTEDYIYHGDIVWFYGLHRTEVIRSTDGFHRDWRPFLHLSDYLTVLKVLLSGAAVAVNHVLIQKRVRDLHRRRFDTIAQGQLDCAFWKAAVRYLSFPVGHLLDLVQSVPWILRSRYGPTQKLRLLGWSFWNYAKGHLVLARDILKGAYLLIVVMPFRRLARAVVHA